MNTTTILEKVLERVSIEDALELIKTKSIALLPQKKPKKKQTLNLSF